MQSSHLEAIVLFGGPSTEHRVSVASAQHLASKSKATRYWFWTREGPVQEVSRSALLALKAPFETDFVAQSRKRWPSFEASLTAVGSAVMLLALHGKPGEDGSVQRALEARGIAFTGSGSEASELALDKARAKECVSRLGVAVANGTVVVADSQLADQLRELFGRHGPLVIKPVGEGSSVGLAFLHAAENAVVVAQQARPGTRLVVEQLVRGRELTVGVIEALDGRVQALPCSEVLLSPGRTFDYDGKYLGKGAQEVTPARVPLEISLASQALAVRCHLALGCRGYSRTDLIVTDNGPIYLETNTLPGLSSASFIPQQLQAAGVELDEFVVSQLLIASARAKGVTANLSG